MSDNITLFVIVVFGFVIGRVVQVILGMRDMDCNEIVDKYPNLTIQQMPARCMVR